MVVCCLVKHLSGVLLGLISEGSSYLELTLRKGDGLGGRVLGSTGRNKGISASICLVPW